MPAALTFRTVVELDTGSRTVEVPSDLAAALATDEGAKRFFDRLSYSQPRRLVLGMEGAKNAETRPRRVDEAGMLRAGRAQG